MLRRAGLDSTEGFSGEQHPHRVWDMVCGLYVSRREVCEDLGGCLLVYADGGCCFVWSCVCSWTISMSETCARVMTMTIRNLISLQPATGFTKSNFETSALFPPVFIYYL